MHTGRDVINKINSKLRFLYRKNRFLKPELQRMLCNAPLQPHFDYACQKRKYKNKKEGTNYAGRNALHILRLDKMHHIPKNDFRLINWLPTNKRVV